MITWQQALAGILLILAIACFYMGWQMVVKYMENNGKKNGDNNGKNS